MEPWHRIEPTSIRQVGWRTITTKTFRKSNGDVVTIDTVHRDGQQFVDVLALTPDNRVVLVKQFRGGPERVMYSLPGGYVDEGESLLEAAKRELLEEAGYHVGMIEYLGPYHKDAYLNATWNAYVAYDCQKVDVPQTDDPLEELEVATVTIMELLELAKHDNMHDHATILMVYDELMKRKGIS